MQAFVRVVEHGSFSRAAEELGVQQSTVSKWVGALEGEVGAQLLVRTTRAQRLTEVGERFFARAQHIIDSYAEATAEIQGAPPSLQGRLRVNLPVVFGQLYVAPKLPIFARAHPDLRLDVVFDDRYLNLVEEGFDVAVRVGVPKDTSARARALGRTPRRLVASPGYLKRVGAPASPADLSAHVALLHSGVERATWTFTRDGRTHRARVSGRLTANHSDTLRTYARAGLGVALLAAWLVDGDIARGRLVSLLDAYRPPTAPIQALMPPGRFVAPKVRAFVDHLETTLSPLFAG